MRVTSRPHTRVCESGANLDAPGRRQIAAARRRARAVAAAVRAMTTSVTSATRCARAGDAMRARRSHRAGTSSRSSTPTRRVVAARRGRRPALASDDATTTTAGTGTGTGTTRAATTAPLAHELVQGALVRWSVERPDGPHPPTCVLVHGILGSRRNLQSLAKRLAEKFPSWQFLLVDLRNHGESNTALEKKPEGANTVQNAARDVLGVLNHLKIYPYTLIGHSFGGKVAMSMVHQFGRALPRPVQVWVLDTVPGDVWCDDVGDHPRDTIRFCTTLDRPIESRRSLVESLTGAGFTVEGAQWMTTNLRADGNGKFDWTFDLDGIAEMYASYEACDLWPMVETQPAGLSLDFVQAERSAFVWTPEDVARIRGTGANVHLLRNSAHWVHIDNPNGLLDILAPSFENMERNSKAR